MFKILDDNKVFYQWDKNRKLIIEDENIKEVHFCNRTDDIALMCEVYEKDGLRLVDVPNKLLTDKWDIKVYASDGDNTRYYDTIKVIERKKPSDYVYEETEVLTYRKLEKRLSEIETAGFKKDVEEYFESHPVAVSVNGQTGEVVLNADDVGALPNTTIIPTTLPNPNALTFTGAVTAEYDGSGAVTVTIPEGSGGSGGMERIEKLSTDTAVELEPNKLYIFPEMAELAITLAEPSDTGIANEYHVVFQSGSTPTSLSIPNTIKLPSNFAVEANYVYRLSILEGCLTAHSWYNRGFTFHVKIDSSLDYPYLFCWESDKNTDNLIWGDNWPGEPMKENENGWFTRELPPRQHNGNLRCIITCETGNKQTHNIDIDASKSDVLITVNASYEYMVYYEEPTI